MKPIERNERAILIRLGQEPGKIRAVLETAQDSRDGRRRQKPALGDLWADAAMSLFLTTLEVEMKDKRGIVTLDCVRG
jgi:hypothetical protein